MSRLLSPVVLVLFFIACDTPVQRFENLDGVIIGWGARSGTVVYIPSTGESRVIPWQKKMRDVHFLCKAQGDTMIISIDSIIFLPETYEKVQGLLKYDPITGNYSTIDSFNPPSSYCSYLDYDEKRREYLFSGARLKSACIHVLDSSFMLKEDQTTACPCEKKPRENIVYDQANWLSNETIVYRCNGSTRLSPSGALDIPSSAVVLAISPDRSQLLYSMGIKKEMKLYVFDIENSNTKQLQIDSKIVWHASFSPDQKSIVFSELTYDFSNSVTLNIYDLATDTFKFTGLYVDGDIYWGTFSGDISKTVQLVQ